jgi:Raf kinase inhibitor-like YbhB/YbcL family protein
MGFKIASEAFSEGGIIPKDYTCSGQDLSPPLRWAGQPAGTKTLTLIVDDPDAPVGNWVHWVLVNLPGQTAELAEGASNDRTLPAGSMEGINDFGNTGYGGPCPPPGPAHRYYFTLYALDAGLSLGSRPKKADVIKAMEGHVLGKTSLMGRYSR